MATTNTNTGDQKLLSSDIYDVVEFLDQIRADNVPDLDETSSMVGMFGYMEEIHSQVLQNALIVAAESSNEAIPTRAKFTKNVINHAMNLGITNIYAKPATMTLLIYLPRDQLEMNFVEQNEISGRGKFILDRNIPFNVGDFEFHLDYDVIINRIKNPQGNYVYTAMYDLFEEGTTNIKQSNPISDITNPYITTIMQTTYDGKDCVAFSARLHQVEYAKIIKNILTNNSIENKSVTFTFRDQLAAFDVDVVDGNETHHLTPVYAGLLDNTLEDGEWCYYEFIDEFTIRLLFNKNSYVPGLNSQVTVNVQTCAGANGNFTYTTNFRSALRSDKYNNYNSMYCVVFPLLNGVSNGGKDKKSISDLRRIIPREASSRGAIINTTDLTNFFNAIDDNECRLYFKKKRDNQFERMYYAYIVMRKNGHVYPTNTLNVRIHQDEFVNATDRYKIYAEPELTEAALAYHTSIYAPVYKEQWNETDAMVEFYKIYQALDAGYHEYLNSVKDNYNTKPESIATDIEKLKAFILKEDPDDYENLCVDIDNNDVDLCDIIVNGSKGYKNDREGGIVDYMYNLRNKIENYVLAYHTIGYLHNDSIVFANKIDDYWARIVRAINTNSGVSENNFIDGYIQYAKPSLSINYNASSPNDSTVTEITYVKQMSILKNESNNLVINPGTIFYYYDHGSDTKNAYCTIKRPNTIPDLDPDVYKYPDEMIYNADGDMMRVFEYMSPFMITIDKDLITSYLMTVMDEQKTFLFSNINEASDLQFITSNMRWLRKFIPDGETDPGKFYDYKYTMTLDIMQNNGGDYGLIKYHYEGNERIYDECRVRVMMVLYADETDQHPYRWLEAELLNYDSTYKMFTFQFTLPTDDLMDMNNRINITGIYNAKPEQLQLNNDISASHGYMKANTCAKIFIMADFGIHVGDTVGQIVVPDGQDQVICYPDKGDVGMRNEIESILPTRDDVIDQFLKNEITVEHDNGDGTFTEISVVSIIRANPDYMDKVKQFNGDEQETELAIMRFLRADENKEFVENVLLKDDEVIAAIESFHYVDLHEYTVCNVMTVDGGIDFYHDYSAMMRSTVTVQQVPKLSKDGEPLYTEVVRTDHLENEYTTLYPEFEIDPLTNQPKYYYTLDRVPLLRHGFLATEAAMQQYVFDLEERRKYITECLYVLEDTFDIDLKFFNTYGPSKQFYYNIPSAQNYKVRVAVKELKVYPVPDENTLEEEVGWLKFGDLVNVEKVKGMWALIHLDDKEGWIRLSDVTKVISYIDNVALTFKWALEAVASADKYIAENIKRDIKEYIEDINQVNELHIPNVITLITNNYREQLVYFEFMDVNGYGSACQHLYLDESVYADICPEFLNVSTSIDGSESPEIDITVY